VAAQIHSKGQRDLNQTIEKLIDYGDDQRRMDNQTKQHKEAY
jgi:hypothetical protein